MEAYAPAACFDELRARYFLEEECWPITSGNWVQHEEKQNEELLAAVPEHLESDPAKYTS